MTVLIWKYSVWMSDENKRMILPFYIYNFYFGTFWKILFWTHIVRRITYYIKSSILTCIHYTCRGGKQT